MNRTRYLKNLEYAVNVSKQVINDLTKENYELRELLKSKTDEQQKQQRPRN